MTKPIHLTLAQVREAGLKAYQEKRLSAQGPTPACRYRDESGRPCVIGAALTDPQAHQLEGAQISMGVKHLAMAWRIEMDRPNELACLQSAHDSWCFALDRDDHHEADRAESRLLALLEGREP